jgi:hypothetical protein
MSLYGCFAGAELRRDLFVEQTCHDERHHLVLARRKRLVPPTPLGQLCPLISCRAVARNRLLNGVEELLVTKRFREEVHRAGLQRLHCHWNITMTGDENDLDRWIHFGQLALEIEAAQSREPHV